MDKQQELISKIITGLNDEITIIHDIKILLQQLEEILNGRTN